MKVLLRHAKTGFYFAGSSQWLTEAVLAHDFQAVESALDFVVRENLPGTEAQLAATGVSRAVPLRDAESSMEAAEQNKWEAPDTGAEGQGFSI